MKNQISVPAKTNHTAGALGILLALAAAAHAGDPRTNCWFTTQAGQYARIYTNQTAALANNSVTTWKPGGRIVYGTQTNPVYAGVQSIRVSSNWVYIRSTGLASYTMGPWQNGAFPNLPENQKVLYRFPRTNDVPATKSENTTEK